MIQKTVSILAVSLLLTMNVEAEQKPSVSMETHSYQLTVVKDKKGKVLKDKKGKPVKKWRKATKVVPGTIVKYIDTITNESDEVIKDAKISNPINENLIFVEGSATSEAKFSVTYSVDGGKHYAVPAKLFVIGKDKKKHPAQAKDYNAILFSVDEVPAQSKVDVSFKVKLK
jgi:uncharacterized repeat protein (TIGR01451 family)